MVSALLCNELASTKLCTHVSLLSYTLSWMSHLSLEISLHTPDNLHIFSLKCTEHGCVDFVLLKALHEAILPAFCRGAAWWMQASVYKSG